MMDPFQIHVDVAYNDPYIGRDAEYYPDLGTAKPIRVIPIQPDVILNIEKSKIQASTAMFRIRVSEVAIFKKKRDKIVFNEITYIVQNAHYHDQLRLEWEVDCHIEDDDDR